MRPILDDGALERLEHAFLENFASLGELGASVSVWREGERVATFSAGRCDKTPDSGDWTDHTLVPVFSATKPAAAVSVLLALDDASLSPDVPIRQIWPGFPADVSVSEMLSHQAGLAALDHAADILDHEAVVWAIEHTVPAWLPPSHGYHPRTYGALCEEVVRRVSGVSLGQFWDAALREPAQLDFWIGLPETEFDRVARLYPGKQDKGDMDTPFYRAFLAEGTLTRRAFSSPRGMMAVADMNTPQAWQAALPGMGGIATADGLARFYQILLGSDEDASLVPAHVRRMLAARQCDGPDRILLQNTAFGRGVMMEPAVGGAGLFGFDAMGFGHAGAGGSLGFADPGTGLSFAYTMNQMELSVLPGAKARALVAAIRP